MLSTRESDELRLIMCVSSKDGYENDFTMGPKTAIIRISDVIINTEAMTIPFIYEPALIPPLMHGENMSKRKISENGIASMKIMESV